MKFPFLKILLIGIVMFVFFACKKTSDNTSAIITLYDTNIEKFIANHYVYLTVSSDYQRDLNDILGLGGSSHPSNSHIIKQGITDINGRYNFSVFETEDKGKYSYSIEGIQLNKGTINNLFLEKDEYTDSFFVNFYPPPPYLTGEYLRVTFHPWKKPRSFDMKYTNNNYFNTSKQFKILASKYYINIEKYKSGIYSNSMDSIIYYPDLKYFYNINW